MVTQLLRLVDDLLTGAAVMQRLAAFWGPVIPTSPVLAPFFALGSLVALALLSGLAVGTVATLLVILLALYLLLTEVFGIAVEVTPGRYA